MIDVCVTVEPLDVHVISFPVSNVIPLFEEIVKQSIKELDDFIESMSHEQFMKVQSFFETMPKVKHKITVKNPKTEVESDLTLEGLQDFF